MFPLVLVNFQKENSYGYLEGTCFFGHFCSSRMRTPGQSKTSLGEVWDHWNLVAESWPGGCAIGERKRDGGIVAGAREVDGIFAGDGSQIGSSFAHSRAVGHVDSRNLLKAYYVARTWLRSEWRSICRESVHCFL